MPRPLGLLLVCVTLLGVAWAWFTPPWEGPDETMHYGYVETLAQRHTRPGVERGGNVLSTGQRLSMRGSNADRLTHISDGRPQWSEAAARPFEQRSDVQRTDDGGFATKEGHVNTAKGNPPGFYVLELPAYAAGAAVGGVNSRLYAMRMFTIASLLLGVVAVWLLIGELVPRQPLAQLAGAASVGLLPMSTHIAASVNPDALLYSLWAVVLWLGVRVLKRGLTLRSGLALVGALVAALAVKATAVAVAPPVLGVLAYGLWKRPDVRARLGSLGRTRVRRVGLGLGTVVVGSGLAFVAATRYTSQLTEQLRGQFEPGLMASYLWQFYLPRLGFMQDIKTVTGIPVYDVWFKDLVGNFAWLQISQPGWLYAVLAVLTVAVAAVGLVALWRDQPRSVVVFFAAVTVVLLAGLHITDYRQAVVTGIGFMQGRYLLPLAGIFAAVLVAAWTRLPERRRPQATALLLGGLLALQIVSFSRAAGFWYV
ncbi:MAG TPA: DUF2142 domain-containing protein [Thermoleophilaceae bacterium]|nr:DUF2142 domain-containing protein [Thermoleophilaceae bacterium]